MESSAGPDWVDALCTVCERGLQTLTWGNPEQWVQTELFATLESAAERTGWKPFPMEVPYVTLYPVTLPKGGRRDWAKDGAIKWVDLCVRQQTNNKWCWFELKVRHPGLGERTQVSLKGALDAFAKDFVGLCGLNVPMTVDAWSEPDQFTKAYWFESGLKPIASYLPAGDHYFVSAYLHLGSMGYNVFTEPKIKERISAWHQWRSEASEHNVDLPSFDVLRT